MRARRSPRLHRSRTPVPVAITHARAGKDTVARIGFIGYRRHEDSALQNPHGSRFQRECRPTAQPMRRGCPIPLGFPGCRASVYRQ